MDDWELTIKHNLRTCTCGRCCNAQLVEELLNKIKELEQEVKSEKENTHQSTSH